MSAGGSGWPTGATCVALSGGVGGAKLALGLSHVVPPENLTIVANVGDDFEHLGLRICPDLDTLMYTLSGLNDEERGWGLAGETWRCMEALGRLGGETWFNLGDADLATHLERTRRLAEGQSLTEVTRTLCRTLGIGPRILPASDDDVRTVVLTRNGPLAFQHYFVRERCAPEVTGFTFEGAETARPSSEVLEALADPSLAAIVVCPSNPFISIDPILAVPGMREALRSASAPVVAIAPVVAGDAIKGPTAKMMRELGMAVDATTPARRYRDLLAGYVVDRADADLRPALEADGLHVLATGTVMRSLEDRVRLAREVADFVLTLGQDPACSNSSPSRKPGSAS